jgi:CelD/BcsL family acetyltransferase involved in cellulose biosynthesis
VATGPLRVVLIDDLADLDAGTVEEWVALVELHGAAYLSPGWYKAWVEARGDRPLIVTVREGKRLVGLIPLIRDRAALRFAGDRSGDDFYALVEPTADRAEVLASIGRGLQTVKGWRRLVARHQRVGADWLDGVIRGLRGRYALVRRPVDPRSVIMPRGQSFEGYLAGLKRGVRKETRRRRRRLEEKGDVVILRADAGVDVDTAIDELLFLHDERWTERGGSDIRDTERMAIRAFAHAAVGHGWLRLWLMRVDGHPGAAEMAVRVGPRQVHFTSGFAPQLAARGVGNVLMSIALEEAIDSGAREIDLGAGVSNYKLDYATDAVPFEHVTLLPAMHPLRFALAAWLGGRSVVVRAMPWSARQRLRDLKRRARGVRARVSPRKRD